MAHKLTEDEQVVIKKTKYNLPNIEGKFGFSLFIGSKELFIGIQISEVLIERVVRKKLVKLNKGKVKTFSFD
jgi:hypothetical protein